MQARVGRKTTPYDWLKQEGFKNELERCRDELFASAMDRPLKANTEKALDKIITLMDSGEKVDGKTDLDLLDIVHETLGGSRDNSLSEWAARRDHVLDLIGKATPGMFQPALKIDPSGVVDRGFKRTLVLRE